MANPTLRTAVSNYGHTKPLKDGTAVSPRFEMEHVDVTPATSIFRRMVRNLEFDVAEMALSTYLCARAHGKAFTGIPVFLTRSFYHAGITYNVKSGIKTAADLAGRRIGVRGYTVTPGVWTRGMLQTVYGLDLNSVTWVLSGDEHVAEYQAPSNVVSSPNSDLVEMLLSGEIDAAIGAGANDSPDIKPLFPDAQEADAQWFKDSGIYPISHMLVVKNQQLEDNPWLAGELFSLCQAAKKPYLEHLHSGADLTPADQALLNLAKIVGDDPIPYGLESSRKTIETFIRFNVDQQVIPESVDVDAVFAL
ncbi:MAG: ABC transporter substrate-binding protein [Chloroflexi bacterium]|nr:ABC transporter substrate-binding protein [Chloroflexota bacterium]